MFLEHSLPGTWALAGALLLHPAVVGRAVSVAGQCNVGASDADAGLSILVIPDPATRQVGGPARFCQLAHRAGGQGKVTLCSHISWVSATWIQTSGSDCSFANQHHCTSRVNSIYLITDRCML